MEVMWVGKVGGKEVAIGKLGRQAMAQKVQYASDSCVNQKARRRTFIATLFIFAPSREQLKRQSTIEWVNRGSLGKNYSRSSQLMRNISQNQKRTCYLIPLT